MFWLNQWMDERGVTSTKDAERRLRSPKEISRLQELAASIPYTTEPLETADGNLDLLGGRGVDLSGELDCSGWSCRKQQVDTLLTRAWHYFDRVVVVGPSPHRVSGDLESGETEAAVERLLSDVRLLLYLREIGAESLVVFRQKPPPCEVHLDQHAREVGLETVLERLDGLAEQLGEEAEIETRPHEDHLDYAFVHPRFEHTVWGSVWPKDDQVPREVSRAVLARYMSHLTSDVRTARMLDLPLASTIQVHGDLMGITQAAPSCAEVMFDLRLPVVEGVDVANLLAVREEEREYFERFRLALRVAAIESLRTEKDSKGAAEEIQREIIEPALIDINVRLRAAADTLATKTRLSTRLSAALTACGFYFGEPLLVSAGITAAGGTVKAAMDHADEVGEVRLSDMYFLWQAQEHHH